eukprot:11335857-Alexandrium_andersonii.AAC.1
MGRCPSACVPWPSTLVARPRGRPPPTTADHGRVCRALRVRVARRAARPPFRLLPGRVPWP